MHRPCRSMVLQEVVKVQLWNSLPESVIEDPTLNTFESRFDNASRYIRVSTDERDFLQ